ncbi:MAG TPA: FlgD immunoglobulin-like domain containing protein [bacterium]|nr:FlgD immunoglobulin-like domain containing protein [bacterium]
MTLLIHGARSPLVHLIPVAIALLSPRLSLAAKPVLSEWTPSKPPDNPALRHDLPMTFRTRSDIEWVRVHLPGQSPCTTEDAGGGEDGRTPEEVWCFEGANGDSSWPANPPYTWSHWSKYAPPGGGISKWHMSQMNPNTSSWNAWCGCDSIMGVNGYSNNDDACSETFSWEYQKGYGDDWNYALEIRADNAPHGSGSTIKFDVRYDIECNYDYLYLEYSTDTGVTWSLARDSYPNGKPAVFNAVSGIPDYLHGGTGRSCGGDYFGSSDQGDCPIGDPLNCYGYDRSQWLLNVSLPLPASTGGIRVRWRAFSDGAWSDEDGRGDTDGHSAIDNIVLTITSNGTTATDNFESATSSPLNGRSLTENIAGSVTWKAGGVIGTTYDGWHLQFDPNYTNKGNSCSFEDDWMWAAKPANGPIPPIGNGFDFFLVSPPIHTAGWSGGVVEYRSYQCAPDTQDKATNQLVRMYDTLQGWSTWQEDDAFVVFGGCTNWNDGSLDFTEFLGANIDSIQVAWEFIDFSKPGDFVWGKHSGAQYLVDNVSFGRFDGSVTSFIARTIDLFADTFSLSDPAHTPFLANADQGHWIGLGPDVNHQRAFASAESLTVDVKDPDGVAAANVDLWWRHDNGGSGTFGAFSKIDMDLSEPDPISPTDEGTYRVIIGKDNGGVEDVDGTASNDRIWKAGTTVHYYVKVTDNAAHVAVFPVTADDAVPIYQEFSVLPFNRTTNAGQRILLVDDYGRELLDFENSEGFDPNGGMGFGAFEDPAFDEPENMIERALALVLGGSEAAPQWDVYDVMGAGSSVQSEPRGLSNTALGLGGFLDDAGNPNYDVLIWTHGAFISSFEESTLPDLKTYLDRNGNLLACGDDVAFDLTFGAVDGGFEFLSAYLGTDFPSTADDATVDRNLTMTGSGGTSLAGVELGLYGDCPSRRDFDRLTQAPPQVGSQNSVLATYTDGDAADNGRAAFIKNVRRGLDNTFGTADDGVAVLSGFDVSALLSDASRACALGRVLASDMAITLAVPPACIANGVAAPEVVATGFEFSLASVNPFRDRAELQLSMSRRERVTVIVYNVLGEKIRVLLDGTLDAGVRRIEWDGKSDDGSQAPSGIYFARLKAGSREETRKLALLR